MGYQHYARTDIETSDPRAVVVLLYEGAIKFLNRAAEAARQDQRMAVSEAILKAQKIVQFLNNALDFEEGGEVAGNLDRLYAYMRDTLNDANLHCSIPKIEEIISLFKTLLEAWHDVAQDPAAAAALESRGKTFIPREAPVDLSWVGENSAPAADATKSNIPAMSGAQNLPGSSSVEVCDTVQIAKGTPPSAPTADAPPQPKVANPAAGRAAYGLRQIS